MMDFEENSWELNISKIDPWRNGLGQKENMARLPLLFGRGWWERSLSWEYGLLGKLEKIMVSKFGKTLGLGAMETTDSQEG